MCISDRAKLVTFSFLEIPLIALLMNRKKSSRNIVDELWEEQLYVASTDMAIGRPRIYRFLIINKDKALLTETWCVCP